MNDGERGKKKSRFESRAIAANGTLVGNWKKKRKKEKKTNEKRKENEETTMRDIDSEPKANNNNNNYNNNSNNSNNNFRGDAFKVGPRPPEGNEPPKNPNSISRMRTFDDFHDESERGAGEKTFVETLSTDRIDWWSIGDQSIEKMAMVDGSFRSRNERTKKNTIFLFFFVMAANAAELVFSTGSKDSSVFFCWFEPFANKTHTTPLFGGRISIDGFPCFDDLTFHWLVKLEK